MSCNKYKETNRIRHIVDGALIDVLENKKAVHSFHSLLDGLLSDLDIRIESFTKPELSILCTEGRYKDLIYIWFYLTHLQSKRFIAFTTTAALEKEVGLGSSKEKQRAYLNTELSDFIKEHDNANLIVSPEFKDYVDAGHVSQELKAARISARASVVAAVFAVFSALVAIASLCISCCHCV